MLKAPVIRRSEGGDDRREVAGIERLARGSHRRGGKTGVFREAPASRGHFIEPAE